MESLTKIGSVGRLAIYIGHGTLDIPTVDIARNSHVHWYYFHLTAPLKIFVKSFGQIHQRLGAESDSSGLVVFPFLVSNKWARNVEVGPRDSLGHEFLEEQSGG